MMPAAAITLYPDIHIPHIMEAETHNNFLLKRHLSIVPDIRFVNYNMAPDLFQPVFYTIHFLIISISCL